MHAESPFYGPRSRRRRRTLSGPVLVALGAGGAVALAVLIGLAFAGQPSELAAGTRVGGVDVGGLTRHEAVARLDRMFAKSSEQPVDFVADTKTYTFAANQLAVQPDWNGAVAAAERAGAGFGPLRGFRRLRARVFGAEVLPRLTVSNGALEYVLDKVSTDVDRSPRSAALVRHGLRISVVAERPGRRLDREAAASVIVRTLGQIKRFSNTTALPVAVTQPAVSAQILAGVAASARTALSGPVVVRAADHSYRLSPRTLARLIALPRGGASSLRIGGSAADAYFRALSHRIGRRPQDARFAVYGDAVQVVPSRDGLEIDVPQAARAVLRAATRPTGRVARLQVAHAEPQRTTAEALAMGIDRRMSSYKTYYAGTADRITNLQLGVAALDDTLVRPGGIFSLNRAIGERTAERGFRPAPVIIGTEYSEEVGGGTSQVATTVFNAAWEAGLRITERHPHSLYISRYPLGRDATVYWPSLDLEFVNDTKSWILVRGFSESDGISVAIYGGEHRRVESSATPLLTTGPVPVQRVKDPTLRRGERVVDAEGAPPSRTSATRKIYASDGNLLRTETWNTSYAGEKRVVRMGTKAPEQKPKKTPTETTPAPEGSATPPPTQR